MSMNHVIIVGGGAAAAYAADQVCKKLKLETSVQVVASVLAFGVAFSVLAKRLRSAPPVLPAEAQGT